MLNLRRRPPRPLHYRWTWTFDASREQLWPYVANVNRFDADIGLAAVVPVGVPDEDQRQRLRPTGTRLAHDFTQEPYQWRFPQGFSVGAEFASGPLARLDVDLSMTDLGDGRTELSYDVQAVPRARRHAALVGIQIGRVLHGRIDRTFRHYARLARPGDEPEPAARSAASRDGLERLNAITTDLIGDGVDPGLVGRLATLIAAGHPSDVARIRPYALADRWARDREDVLDLFMRATRRGALDFRWDLLCPLCRVAKSTAGSLDELETAVHCDSCNIDYSADFSASVELTFTLNPAIRRVEVDTFCFGGPMDTPHVLAQQVTESDGTTTLSAGADTGPYRLRCLGGRSQTRVDVRSDAASAQTVDMAEGQSGGVVTIAPSGTLTVHGLRTREVLVLERLGWSDEALVAADVISRQQFRDLFADETLRPGQQVSVGRVSVLFTDLVGSTAHYRNVGDAVAFGQVMNHFEVLQDEFAQEGGSLVKTIGDATMSVFSSPAAAIRGHRRAQVRLRDLDGGLTIRAGLHTGPAIAVTLNGRLDYFGTTVNMAARLESLSVGGELMTSTQVVRDPEVHRMLQSDGCVPTAVRRRLKGFDEDAHCYALETPPGPRSAGTDGTSEDVSYAKLSRAVTS